MQGYLVHDPGWNGTVKDFNWRLYHLIGHEISAQELASAAAHKKYRADLDKKNAYRRRRTLARKGGAA